ncbi:hypothetical protein ACW7G5_14585 [Luteimonas sp. A501]
MNTDQFYEIALDEYESNRADRALVARALVRANGDEAKVKVEYIKLRVSQLSSRSPIEPPRGVIARILTVEQPRDTSSQAHGEYIARVMFRVALVLLPCLLLLLFAIFILAE